MMRLVSLAAVVLVSGLVYFGLASDGGSQGVGDTSIAAAQEPKAGEAKPGQKNPGKNPGKKNQGQNNQAKKQGGGAGTGAQANAPSSPPPPTAKDAGVPILSSGDSYDDFASIAQASDGTLYAAYAAYYDAHDQIRVHKQLKGGNWSTRTHMPLVQARADIWMPQLAIDAQDRLWAIWSEQTGQTATSTGNWDLYARALEGNAWGPLVRLTDSAKPDINHHVAIDATRNIYVVWQAHPENNGDIMLVRFDGAQWSKPLAVTSGAGADWYPQVAVDNKGTAWIVFDSYRNGDYDVYLTSVSGDRVSEPVAIAKSNYYEAHPTVTCTPEGKVWIAWEQAGHNWGKDQGHWLRKPEPGQKAEAHPAGGGLGTPLGSTRSVKVVMYQDGMVRAAPDLAKALPNEGPPATAFPMLASGADGRLWLSFRRMGRGAMTNARGQFRRFWTQDVTYLTDEGWKPTKTLPGSTGRISVFNRILPLPEGGLAVAYSSDQRNETNYHQPIQDQVLVTTIAKPEDSVAAPMLAEYQQPAPPVDSQPWDVARDRAQVKAIRDHRAKIDGQEQRIVRGDLHRHTELSWDVGPGNDGSFLDFYRYMIDVAEMDFGALTDHQGGGHYAYHWWLTEKSADMYYLPPRFVPLYGYERSVKFPNGHRNVFHSYRGVPVFAFQLKLDQTGVFPGIASGDVLENDTKLLYEYLHKTGGIAISHTSATDTMGTDWRDNDPKIEPVVEIYQGARNSYEVVGGPRVHDITTQKPEQAPGGYQAAGMVWNALAKGYRLGMTSSSDHGSTHISYSLVYTPENDRKAILDAIRKRHTYGATDNLIVDVRCGDRFMGEEFTTKEKPQFDLKVQSTGKVARIDLVRNNQYIYTTAPNTETVALSYADREPAAGLNYYYFRIQQEDGEIAWASPMWIHYKP
jgi:hypothetical protein